MTFTAVRKDMGVMASHSVSGDKYVLTDFRGNQQGFTYIGVLFAVAIMGVALLALSEMWVKTAERQAMSQLDWVGQQYVKAIESYYYSGTGSAHIYPKELENLLEDKRYLSMRRHIRVLYTPPLIGNVEWKAILAPDGGIQGVALQQGGGAGLDRKYIFVPHNN
jgi:type II secretory pathway pseudopilin PulG